MTLNSIKILVPAALLGAALLPLSAHADSLNGRLHDQHQRIHQGVVSGQLTRREQFRLNARDARINRQETRDRRHDDGHLTTGERNHIQRELNHSSGAIYRDKHNDHVR